MLPYLLAGQKHRNESPRSRTRTHLLGARKRANQEMIVLSGEGRGEIERAIGGGMEGISIEGKTALVIEVLLAFGIGTLDGDETVGLTNGVDSASNDMQVAPHIDATQGVRVYPAAQAVVACIVGVDLDERAAWIETRDAGGSQTRAEGQDADQVRIHAPSLVPSPDPVPPRDQVRATTAGDRDRTAEAQAARSPPVAGADRPHVAAHPHGEPPRRKQLFLKNQATARKYTQSCCAISFRGMNPSSAANEKKLSVRAFSLDLKM